MASLCGPTCGGELFTHVLGAVVLFGSVGAVALLSLFALRRPPEQALVLRRIAFWTTLALAVPAWVVMYFGGFWTLDHEGLDDHTPGWADAGITIAHVLAVLVLLLGVLAWLASRRPRWGLALAAVAVISAAALGVAWGIMSAKP